MRFDGQPGDTPAGIQPLACQSACRTMFHAPPARTAADTLIGPVISIDRHIHHQFAEQQERAVTGRDEQRIASYETEARFAGEPFLQQRSRIRKGSETRSVLLQSQPRSGLVQHLLHRDMIIPRTGIRRHLGYRRIAVTEARIILVGDTADHHRARSGHQFRRRETLLHIPA